jgi:hypothetical protein
MEFEMDQASGQTKHFETFSHLLQTRQKMSNHVRVSHFFFSLSPNLTHALYINPTPKHPTPRQTIQHGPTTK